MEREIKKLVIPTIGKNYKIYPLSPEGSERSYFRIKTKTSSWILVKSSKEQNKLFQRKKKDLNRIKTILTPNIILSRGKFLLVEDLGEFTLHSVLKFSSPKNLYYYQKVLDSLLILENKKDDFSHWPVFSKQKLYQEMHHTYTYFIKGFLKLNVTPSSQWLESYSEECRELCDFLSRQIYSPSHRDYHSKNLMYKEENFFWLDFQDAGLFPRFYDLVSIVFDSYAYFYVSSQRRKQLCYYFFIRLLGKEKNELGKSIRELKLKSLSNFKQGAKVLREKNKKLELDHYNGVVQEMYKTALQRLFKALGSFAFIYLKKKQKSHLQYVRPAISLLKEISQKIKGYTFLKKVVREISLATERKMH